MATAELGHDPETVEEYADAMELSRATAFRDQQAFRKAFPRETSPLRVNQVSGAQDRYDSIWKQLRDRAKAIEEVQPVMYMLGGALADY